jgi:hypothetical protein
MAGKGGNDKKPMEEQGLPNGMVLCLYDHSQRLAGDRWVVRLQGELRIAVAPEFFSLIKEDDPELLATIRERLGSELVFTLAKERYFIAEEEKNAVMAELLARIRENVLTYLKSSSFPRKLFGKQYEEQKRQILLARKVSASRLDDQFLET